MIDVLRLTRELIDIPSVSGDEFQIGTSIGDLLVRLGYHVQAQDISDERSNIIATTERPPRIVLSTHMDTVPPFIPSSEDASCVYGRGACDAKGIIAAQIAAAEKLKQEGIFAGLLFLVGEERDSLGAKVANEQPNSCKFLINGEPTENRVATASKGALRVELTATGRMAHSAYPELGQSAIDKLVEALHRLRAMKLPEDPEVGPCTVNIGIIEGGRAPNVISDKARALLLFRLVAPSEPLRQEIVSALGGLVKVEFTLDIPFVRLHKFEGLPTMVAKFTTDIPALSNWGRPLLLGPGSIHVAHTEGEYVEKKQLREAVELYCGVARKLQGK